MHLAGHPTALSPTPLFMPLPFPLRTTIPCAAIAALIGCGGPSVDVPAYNAAQAASEAIELYDKNNDGKLDADELKAAPALQSAQALIDTDGDGNLSRDEIAARIAQYAASNLGAVQFHCTVLLNGQPLSRAKVRLVPEPYLSSSIEPAVATTDESGAAFPRIESSELPGVRCGLYRIEIVAGDGQTAVPSRYNADTELGQEVSSDTPGLERGITYALKGS